MRFFLGVDGGGSKCDVALIDETGTVLGWGTGGSTRTTYIPAEAVIQSYRQAMAGALGENFPGELWVCGDTLDDVVQEWLTAQNITVHQLPVGEMDRLYGAALRSWGIVVLAGTGSFVHGRTPAGKEIHLGSLGYILGDEGGGYDIGRRGLKAAWEASWTARKRTSLAEAIPKVIGDFELNWTMVYTGEMGPKEIAALAPVVTEQAMAGDRISLAILHQGAESLAELAAIILDKLDVIGQAYPVIGIGGVIQGAPMYWQILSEKILQHDPTLVPTVPLVKPAVGAAFVGMQQVGLPVTGEIRDRVVATQQAFPEARVNTVIPRPSDATGGV